MLFITFQVPVFVLWHVCRKRNVYTSGGNTRRLYFHGYHFLSATIPNRQHLKGDDCLVDKRKGYQSYSVL